MLIAVAIIASFIIVSCTSPSQKVENAEVDVAEAEENLIQSQNDYAAEVANFRKETEVKITSNEKIIADIKLSMQNEKKSINEDYQKLVSDLETKNSDMRKKMTDYKDESNEKWQSFQTEFNRDMDELGAAIKNLTINNVK